MRVIALNTQLFRRLRYVPLGIGFPAAHLGFSGRGDETPLYNPAGEAYLSQHWGDLNHYLNFRNFLDGIERLRICWRLNRR